jgi:hypothetical protein
MTLDLAWLVRLGSLSAVEIGSLTIHSTMINNIMSISKRTRKKCSYLIIHAPFHFITRKFLTTKDIPACDSGYIGIKFDH